MVVLPDADLDMAADAAVSRRLRLGRRAVHGDLASCVAVGDDRRRAGRRRSAERIPTITGRPGHRARQRDGPADHRRAPRQGRRLHRRRRGEGATVVVDGRDGASPATASSSAVADRQRRAGHGRATTTRSSARCSAVVRVDSYDEALRAVNDNPYGNGTAIFTRDGGAARQFQFDVQVGMVGVNVPIPVPVATTASAAGRRRLFGDTAHVRPRGHQLLHPHQGRHVAAGPTRRPVDGRPRLPAGRAEAASAVDFGVVLQTNPPALARRRAGQAGRAATASATCGRSTRTSCGRSRSSSTARSWPTTRKVIVGPMVTNPATRDWTVTAIAVRHAQRDVRQPHRLRHRPRRLGGAGHQRQADHAGHAARVRSHVIRELANGRERRLQGQRAAVPVGGRQPARGVGRRVRPEGAGADRRGRRRVHPAARRPRHRRLDDQGGARRRGRRPGRDPDAIKICVAAPAYVGDDLGRTHARPVPLVRRDGRQPRRRHRRPLRRRDGARARRRSPTTSRAARATTTTSTAGPATRTPTSCPTRSSTGSASSARSSEHIERLAELQGARRRPVRHLPAARRQGRDAAGLRRARHPGRLPTGDGQGVTPERPPRSRGMIASRLRCSSCCGRATRRSATRDGTAVLGVRAPAAHRRPGDAARVGRWCSRLGEPERTRPGTPVWLRRRSTACLVHARRRRWSGWSSASVVGLGLAIAHAALPGRRARAAALRGARPDRAARSRSRRSSSGWGGALSVRPYAWQDWMSVAVIAAYLAFFPVAVGDAARPAVADAATSVELMRTLRRRLVAHAASSCGCPARVPYLFPALRLAGAAAVVGAVVAEISTGTARRHRPADHRVLPGGHLATRRRCTPRCSAPPCSASSSPAVVGLLDRSALRRGTRLGRRRGERR